MTINQIFEYCDKNNLNLVEKMTAKTKEWEAELKLKNYGI